MCLVTVVKHHTQSYYHCSLVKPVCCEANVAVFFFIIIIIIITACRSFCPSHLCFSLRYFFLFRLGTTQIAFYAPVTMEHHSQSDPTKMDSQI